MPTTFHDREQAFEAKFAHDEEFRFLALARRDKLFAHWAAEKLTLSDEATDALVKAVLAVRDGRGHDQDLLKYVAGVLGKHGHGAGENLAVVLEHHMNEARKQLIEHPHGLSDAV